jgi:hypothetical protein
MRSPFESQVDVGTTVYAALQDVHVKLAGAA